MHSGELAVRNVSKENYFTLSLSLIYLSPYQNEKLGIRLIERTSTWPHYGFVGFRLLIKFYATHSFIDQGITKIV